MSEEKGAPPSFAAMLARRRVAFTVEGNPAPQGSKRHVGNGRLIEMSKRVGPWRESVATAGAVAMGGQAPLDGPLEVLIMFFLPRGTTVKREYPSVVPDVDKLARAVLDGLTAGGVIADDARVVDLHARKQYATAGSAEITVRELAVAA